MEKIFDVAIIGGGINGCGIAADASMRHLSVFLCEQDDLASKTSSSSTKLIHGGLRYLEQFDFKMVKKSLEERQKLLRLAPHLVKPLPLILPHAKGMRPLWILRLGLFIYDHLSSKNRLPKSLLVKKNKYPSYFKPLQSHIFKGFRYYDCSTNDSRLTITNALQAEKHGAVIRPRSKLIHATVCDNLWHLTLLKNDGEKYIIKARTVINATGPWARHSNEILNIKQHHQLALVKGSHLVVDKLYHGDHAYFLQHEDKRLVFVIPYHQYTMIGTTDVQVDDFKELSVSEDEIDYLLEITNKYFKTQLDRSHIKQKWYGVRPLIHDKNTQAKSISRDYTFEFSQSPAPAITIYGGKITTYRQLASDVVDAMKSIFPNLSKSISDTTPLPGATHGSLSYDDYIAQAQVTFSWLEKHILTRYLSLYGTRTQLILNAKQNMSDLGVRFTKDLYQAELDYLIENEWAVSVDDVLYRRTQLGINIDDISRQKIKKYLIQHPKLRQSHMVL